MPRIHLSLRDDDKKSIGTLNLSNTLVMIEEGDDGDADDFLSFLQLSEEVHF